MTTVEEAVNAAPAVGKEVVIIAATAFVAGCGYYVFRKLKKIANTDPYGKPVVTEAK